MQKYLILVAGGRGTRMNADQPKQFIRIGKYPILYYSMKVFYEFDPAIKIILVLPSDMIPDWEGFLSETGISLHHKIV
jgi:2-C-methyl-D-erythritol 4-phosphate cytidylyltransferase